MYHLYFVDIYLVSYKFASVGVHLLILRDIKEILFKVSNVIKDRRVSKGRGKKRKREMS